MADIPDPLGTTPELDRLVRRARLDDTVVGLYVFGSAARDGMVTRYSDVDVCVVLSEPSGDWATVHSPAIDVVARTLDDLRDVPADPGDWWDRYACTQVRILLDRTDGALATALHAQATLSDAEVHRALETYLDGYVNFAYRSLKSHRDGRTFEAKLDAVESVAWALPVVFALHHRVRPYNKYLRWELARRPLTDGWIDGATLIDLVGQLVDGGDPAAQRALFGCIEPAARRAGFGPTIDAWGHELALFR
ncbi:hypothetical protein Athai_60080 [Actinocatenispora thailandica]|uniref:Polymerase nucleotidyl transferase domain-containing protein n=1 Tax=Actinocatenispora thailandica TaxID=227318 RepID=A0A7R7DV97_9ACTN|nr:nucleotidyltransferase domain-containing protein [Actinocatenispora thailandica]BCJ38505.1 hypothetical protein Athai_60080 [Actinocatenispora thailandica]